jgi:transposase
MAWRNLTPQQWEAIHVHLPETKVSTRGGRPRVDDRRCFEGILWILWTGAQWGELPRRSGSPSTCWRRLKQWEEGGVLLTLWRAFLAQLNDEQKLRWDEGFVDGSFIPAKKGGPRSGRPSAGRVQSGWFWSMARALRWEHTWTRRPRRRAPSSSRPSTRSPSAARGSLGGHGSAPSG